MLDGRVFYKLNAFEVFEEVCVLGEVHVEEVHAGVDEFGVFVEEHVKENDDVVVLRELLKLDKIIIHYILKPIQRSLLILILLALLVVKPKEATHIYILRRLIPIITPLRQVILDRLLYIAIRVHYLLLEKEQELGDSVLHPQLADDVDYFAYDGFRLDHQKIFLIVHIVPCPEPEHLSAVLFEVNNINIGVGFDF